MYEGPLWVGDGRSAQVGKDLGLLKGPVTESLTMLQCE